MQQLTASGIRSSTPAPRSAQTPPRPHRSGSRTSKGWILGVAGVAVGVGGYLGYRWYEAHKTPPLSTTTPPVTSQPSTHGVRFTVHTMYLNTVATRVGYPLEVLGTLAPSLTGTGVVWTCVDQFGTVLATVNQGTQIAVNVIENAGNVYPLRWQLTENGTVLATGKMPQAGYWINPTAANAITLFGGNQQAIQDYLAAWPYQAGVQSAANALAYSLQNTLAGTEFGYPVAGLQHTVAHGIVTNTILAVPSGATVTYATLGTDPVTHHYVLIGKTVNGQLWQVYAQAPSGGSGGTGGSGTSTSLAQAEALYAKNMAAFSPLQVQEATNTRELAKLQAAISRLESQLQSQLAGGGS